MAENAPQTQTQTQTSRGSSAPRRARHGQRPGPRRQEQHASDAQDSPDQSASRHEPRPSRGRGRGARNAQQIPHVAHTSSNTSAGNGVPDPRIARGRGGRGPRSGLGQSRVVQGRLFGGQLTNAGTTTDDTSASAAVAGTGLQPDASAFVPGQPVAQSKALRQTTQHRKVKSVRSNAPDIATRIHEDIDSGLYECAVCTNEIYRNSKVWCCRTCWTVFHLSCVKKWSKSDGAKVSRPRQEDPDLAEPIQWRCPGLQLTTRRLPECFHLLV